MKMTEIANTYYENEMKILEKLNNKADCKSNRRLQRIFKKAVKTNTKRMNQFAEFANINSIDDLFAMGRDGIDFGTAKDPYRNIALVALRCFSGKSFRKEFAEKTLYQFFGQLSSAKGSIEIKFIRDSRDRIIAIDRRVIAA